MQKLKFNHLIILLFSLLVTIACKKEMRELSGALIVEKSDLDNYIIDRLKATDAPFDWADTDDEILFKALKFSDSRLVIGYSDGINPDNSLGNSLLRKVYELEGKTPSNLGELDETLIYKDEELGYFNVQIEKLSTLKSIRRTPGVVFTQPSEYVPDLKLLGLEIGGLPSHGNASSKISSTSLVDPAKPNYAQQVRSYSSSMHTKMVRHNVDKVYSTYGKFGEGIGVAILDNGLAQPYVDFFYNNGYGNRNSLGFFTPLWLLNSQPDGIEPLQYDLLGISYLIQGLWLHGSQMMESVLLVAPNSNITTVRAASFVALLFEDQIIGVSKALTALANDPNNKVASMSMGTIFNDNRIGNAVRLYNNNGKILNCAAGTMLEGLKKALGIIYPASMPQTLAITGISDRTTTDGVFVAGETSHTGRRLDFCVERNTASSEATSSMAGMVALIWSANPSLSNTVIKDILIQSSYFYENSNGEKNKKFGWGTVDVLKAFEMALAK